MPEHRMGMGGKGMGGSSHGPVRKKRILQRMGHEMKENPPAVLAKTKKKKGKAAAEKQRKAILLAKARRAGASIPRG